MNDDFDRYVDSLDTAIPEAPLPESVPMEKTVLVDMAGELEAGAKPYVATEGNKPFEKRKAEGVTNYAPPVDVYEPGFRSDLYEALVAYFRKQADTKARNQRLREKIGWRS